MKQESLHVPIIGHVELHDIRIACGFSAREVCNALALNGVKISYSHFVRLESGERGLSPAMRDAWATTLVAMSGARARVAMQKTYRLNGYGYSPDPPAPETGDV